ncbi:MAG: hypothetical protein WBB69_15205 [Anaerolineales bacterium]
MAPPISRTIINITNQDFFTLLAIGAVTLLSLVVGFIQGVVNNDIMNAAAGIKMLFLPIGAAVAEAELLSGK